MSKIILALVVSVLAISCSRPKGEASKIVIELPNTAAQKNTTSTTTGVDEEIADPSELSSFNCIAIGVGADDLTGNTCGRIDSSTQDFDGTKDIKFGLWSGMKWIGSSTGTTTIEMEVPTGSGRTFHAFGIHTDQESCEKFSREYDKSKASKPFLLGSSAATRIDIGNDDPVKIELLFSKENWLDTCKGPNLIQTDSDNLPAKLNVTKSSFPANTTVDGQCEMFEYRLIDKFNQPANAPEDFYFKMQVASQSGYQTVYDTANDCAPGNGSQTEIKIEKGKSSTWRWTKITYGTSASYNVLLVPMTTTPSVTVTPTPFYAWTSDTNKVFKIIGPSRILPSQCYDYYATPKKLSGADTGETYDNTSLFSINLPTGATFFPDGCEGLASTTLSDNLDGGYATFGIKFPSADINAEQTLHLLDDQVNLDILDSSYSVRTGSGSNDIRALNVIDRSLPLERGECRGPYFVTFLNETDTVIKARLPQVIKLKADSGVTAYTSSGCSGTATTTFEAAANSTVTKFYLKAESTLATSVTTRSIEFERAGSGSSIKRIFNFGVKP